MLSYLIFTICFDEPFVTDNAEGNNACTGEVAEEIAQTPCYTLGGELACCALTPALSQRERGMDKNSCRRRHRIIPVKQSGQTAKPISPP